MWVKEVTSIHVSANSTKKAIEVFQEHNGLLRTKDALELGIHPRTLYRMRDEGAVELVSRGIYRLASTEALADPDLATVAMRVPRAVICLISALAFHEATTEIPHEVYVALPRRTKAPQIAYPPLRVFWFSGAALTMGVQVVDLDGVKLRVYDLPKTVVDCFRFRNKVGLDVAVQGLRAAMTQKGVRAAELLRYARACHMERIILPYLEAMQ